jgi:hypothetical protein
VTKSTHNKELVVLEDTINNKEITELVLSETKDALSDLIDDNCDFSVYYSYGNECLRYIGEEVIFSLTDLEKTGYKWLLSVGEMHSKFMTFSNTTTYLNYKIGELYFTLLQYIA